MKETRKKDLILEMLQNPPEEQKAGQDGGGMDALSHMRRLSVSCIYERGRTGRCGDRYFVSAGSR